MEISSNLIGLILGLGLPALAGFIVLAVVRYITAARGAQARAEMAGADDFRLLAENATDLQKKTLLSPARWRRTQRPTLELRTVRVELAELRERMAALEKLLREVGEVG
ncbi:MAG: hypothetical protein GEV03_03740 [Streptosporangiales bacterium]|nr:hypothetical protein [Streptosporangiales bacterium]